MHQILFFTATVIGLWYARKYGREAITKINKYQADKEFDQTRKP